MAKKSDKREPNGRFAKGNPGGPGRPKGRGFELQRAAQAAVTPEHIQGIIRKATMQALKGDVVAARLVLDRTCGRSPDPAPQAEALDVELPKLATAADCERFQRLACELPKNWRLAGSDRAISNVL